jgi:hypothetical protein
MSYHFDAQIIVPVNTKADGIEIRLFMQPKNTKISKF